MDVVRRMPLFVRIGLMWWVVLLAWPPSRPFVFYAGPIGPSALLGVEATPLIGAPLSLVHALAAGWLVVRVLQAFDLLRSFDSAVSWGLIMAWLAISSWWAVFGIAATIERVLPTGDVLLGLGSIGLFVITSLGIPLLAILAFPKAIVLLWPLGILTVWLVRRARRAAEDAPTPLAGARGT